MSVHGEFSRALEALIDRLRGFDHLAAADWIALLEETRIGQQPMFAFLYRHIHTLAIRQPWPFFSQSTCMNPKECPPTLNRVASPICLALSSHLR